jgi:glycosyltransferase 2 family protein
MSTSVADELETATPPRAGGAEKNIAIFAAKLVVTGACFWYVFRQVDPIETLSGIARLDVRWAAFATFIVMLQIPIVALRWRNVLQALGACDARMTRAAMIAITAIGLFFGQVLPSVASEGVRAWLLVRLGGTWRYSVTSLVIDRGVGVGLLITLGFGVLLLPSGLTALGGYREAVLIVYGALLAAGLIGLLLAPRLVPYIARWRYFRWTASLVGDAERVLLGPRCPVIVGLGCLIHALTILVVWSVARAQGLVLPLPDAAALFTVMVGVLLVPISVSGWGLRELATVSLLGNHGVAPETALLFSVCFGLVNAVGSLPGALAWLLYSTSPARRAVERGE